MNILDLEKGVDRLILPRIHKGSSPRHSPRALTRRNTSQGVLTRSAHPSDVTARRSYGNDVTGTGSGFPKGDAGNRRLYHSEINLKASYGTDAVIRKSSSDFRSRGAYNDATVQKSSGRGTAPSIVFGNASPNGYNVNDFLPKRSPSSDIISKGTKGGTSTHEGSGTHDNTPKERNSDVTLKVPGNSTSPEISLTSHSTRDLIESFKNEVTLQVPSLARNDLSGASPEVNPGSSCSMYPDEPFDSDDDLRVSMTLPRIEKVLRDEGFRPTSITNQINRIKYRKGKSTKSRPARPRIKTSRLAVPGTQATSSSTSVSAQQPISRELCSPSPRPAPIRSETSPRPRRRSIHIVSASEDRDNNNSSDAESDADLHVQPEQDGTMLHRSCNDYSRDIAQIRWVSQQQLEIGVLNTHPHYVPPRMLLVSSNVPGSESLIRDVLLHRNDVIANRFDFDSNTYKDLTDTIDSKLTYYLEGAKAKSILLYCQGGAGYLYLLKKRVVTAKKLLSEREEHKSMIQFWQDLGESMSKLEPSESAVHIAGLPLMDDEQGQQLIDTLRDIVFPNQVQFHAVNDETAEGLDMLSLYLDVKKYKTWKKQWL